MYPSFLPPSKNLHVRLIGDSKFDPRSARELFLPSWQEEVAKANVARFKNDHRDLCTKYVHTIQSDNIQ